MTCGSQPPDAAPDDCLTYKTVGDAALQIHVFRPAAPSAAELTPDAAAPAPGVSAPLPGVASMAPCTEAPTPVSAALAPGIVFFFGGGWIGGTPTQFFPHCQYLASRGMVAMSAEYRVQSRHGTTPFECVADGKSAVRWIRQHSRELGVDPARLAAGGGSAGGHVAAAAGTLRGLDEPEEDHAISSIPDALVLFNPVFDNSPEGFGQDQIGERWRELSPLHNISAAAPPTVVFLGSQDRLIPVTTAERYRDVMQDVGGRCDLHVYAGEPHGFFNYRDGSNPFYATTVTTADLFLATLGYLSGEPTL
jgi:acetyl esterase